LSQPQRFLVGGAVRDRLLGLDVTERDWVITGATPEQMEAEGYKPVGRDFPVFLHPDTGEEYALARTERKQGRGYHGFVFHTGADVRLEDDLLRRDLTVNAMAEDAAGHLIDPHGGQDDLDKRLLRHVSPAFAEDPVRLLRLARFYARFKPLGFTVAPDTLALARDMVTSGEVDHLQPERVWNETRRALAQDEPAAFFELLRECGALAPLFPEVDALFGVPQTPRWHPEIDTGVHVMMALQSAAAAGASLRARFAVLCHDLGKALTPPDILPGHRGHERAGLPVVETLCERLRVPRDYREVALLITRWHLHAHRITRLRPATLHDLLVAFDSFRRPDRLDDFIDACAADLRGRRGFGDRPFEAGQLLREAASAAAAVSSQAVMADGHTGAAIGEALRQRRIAAISALRSAWLAG
jgi:tRNA nucleotidyltransferase (CCA-adding enzyme)